MAENIAQFADGSRADPYDITTLEGVTGRHISHCENEALPNGGTRQICRVSIPQEGTEERIDVWGFIDIYPPA